MSFLALVYNTRENLSIFEQIKAIDFSEKRISAITNNFVSKPVPDGEREAELRSHVHEELMLLLLRTKTDYSLKIM
jgi:hypothetical protein